MPARFVLRAGRLAPRRVLVPGFFAVEVSVRNADLRAHRVAVPGRGARRIPPGGRWTASLPGLRRGRTLTVSVDGRPAARVTAVIAPGP